MAITKLTVSSSLLFSYSGEVSLVNSNIFNLEPNLWCQLADFSWHKLLIGAKYKHFNWISLICVMIASSNITVLPEDVGADTTILDLYLVNGL